MIMLASALNLPYYYIKTSYIVIHNIVVSGIRNIETISWIIPLLNMLKALPGRGITIYSNRNYFRNLVLIEQLSST